MTREQERELETVLTLRLKPWRDHREYDDLRQEGRIAAWKALERYEGAAGWRTVAMHAIDWSRSEYLRGPRCLHRHATRAHPLPEVVSLEDLTYEPEHEGRSGSGVYEPTGEAIVPDFVPELLDHLFGQWLWGQREQWLLPRQAEILQRQYWDGESVDRMPLLEHCSRSRMYQIRDQGLDAFRRRLGLPCRFPRVGEAKRGAPR